MGYLVDMSRATLGADRFVQDMVSTTAKIDSQSSEKPTPQSFSPLGHVYFFYDQQYYSNRPDYGSPIDHLEDSSQVQGQGQYWPLNDQVEKVPLRRMDVPVEHLRSKVRPLNGRVINRRNRMDYQPKICVFFSRGNCKHGDNCRYLHGQASPNGFSLALGRAHDDQFFVPGSLEKLESEIVEILKSRRGNPLSIASLPMIYLERYRKVLQAEGYLTESQRNGKTGHSLTRLLSRLNSIRLIDRPHGQHAVILAEDASKYLEGRNEGTLINSKSRQIYLTFPAESTFTEEDVSKYFSTYGHVEDVRIPCQQKRMFGFVTFVLPETAQSILAKGNPHYVRGARILVKPYKEKPKLNERKCQERVESRLHHHHMQLPYAYADSELCSMLSVWETLKFLRYQQLMEEQEQALENQRRQQLLMRKNYQQQSYLLNSISEDCSNTPSANCVNYSAGVMTGNSADGRWLSPIETVKPDEESDELNLPDSPFDSSIIDSITNLINDDP